MNLALVKSDIFEGCKVDIYQNNDKEFYMTVNQLSKCLGYASTSGIKNTIARNKYLDESEFSTSHRLCLVEGNRTVSRTVRLFTEDGIYEVALLSQTPIAKNFRHWVRKVLKEIRQQNNVKPEELLKGKTQSDVKNITELALDIDKNKKDIYEVKAAIIKISELIDSRLNHDEDIINTLVEQVEKITQGKNDGTKNVKVRKKSDKTSELQTNCINDMLNTTVQFYEQLRKLATTDNGYIGDKYVLALKRLLGRFKNKKLVFKNGFDEQTIFEKFDYEYHEANTYDTTKSFAYFLLKCNTTGNYRRIFVCDIKQLKGSKLFLTDCSLRYEFN